MFATMFNVRHTAKIRAFYYINNVKNAEESPESQGFGTMFEHTHTHTHLRQYPPDLSIEIAQRNIFFIYVTLAPTCFFMQAGVFFIH